MEKNKNRYSTLSKILNGDMNPMGLNSSEIDGLLQPKSDFPLRYDNAKDYEDALLKLRQKDYQDKQFSKITNDAYQKSVFYETTKLASYLDYEQMEYFPEIATALNILSEESTTLFDDGTMLKIESDSDRIKKILENLFNDVLQINVSLPYWTRVVCKYGDAFLYVKSEERKGVTKVMQMKNIEIKRVEGNDPTNNYNKSDDDVKFIWEGKNESFNQWQMLHFRMIGDDKKLPYGTSVLDKVRKVFKQLSLAEDAMMTYRITRAPERRVFKVDVGNIDPNDVPNYIDKISAKFKKNQRVNQNGDMDYRFNVLTNDEDFFVPVRGNVQSTIIDTLPGAQNLSDIGDIEFLHKKLFSGLQIPKSFLGFDEASGDGKSLSMQDIRFARTINKIQQVMLMELNKLAIIHLYLLGFEDELNNFKLSLARSSKQAEILENEILSNKLDNFIKAVSKVDGGFAPMSYTEASKKILSKNGDEIILSLQQQFVEAQEASKLGEEFIKNNPINTAIFDGLMDRYRVNKVENGDNENPESGDDFGGGDSFGGGGFGGGSGSFDPDTPFNFDEPEGEEGEGDDIPEL